MALLSSTYIKVLPLKQRAWHGSSYLEAFKQTGLKPVKSVCGKFWPAFRPMSAF